MLNDAGHMRIGLSSTRYTVRVKDEPIGKNAQKASLVRGDIMCTEKEFRESHFRSQQYAANRAFSRRVREWCKEMEDLPEPSARNHLIKTRLKELKETGLAYS